MLIIYVIPYVPESTRSPLGNTTPIKDSPPLKSQKSLAPRKYTTSNFSASPLISGGFIPYLICDLIRCI